MTDQSKFSPMSTKELAALYKVNVNIFRKWLQPFRNQVGVKIGQLYRPAQVKTIFQVLGDPE
jgi:hypothetical protein